MLGTNHEAIEYAIIKMFQIGYSSSDCIQTNWTTVEDYKQKVSVSAYNMKPSGMAG